ncbi:pheromone cAD1 o protein [Leptotrichia sp. OH3620_COT-345]|uniref:pheromone cAD1 o protein n=1 Tax=Leptotrichia sp. OH3620_COT-345 TaxID=2491048 RepID=UPI000F64D85C|nr:pheromone cAD1 o protein [Leptotrichia sp. OH3620_COT-345]RRD40926.1 pheromone cAD1 o protein [Leptotrichia sp. OH3620_COT-345]
MKKIVTILMFLMAFLGFSAMKDGIYYAEKNSGGNWKAFVKLTIKSDKIIGVQYDRKNNAGELLSIDQKENEKYKAKFGETFRDASFSMTRNLVSSQNLSSVRGVKDGTALSEFKELVQFLINKANAGETGNFKL